MPSLRPRLASGRRLTSRARSTEAGRGERILGCVIQLAGIPVARELVLELADRLALFGADDTAALLLIAHACEDDAVGLSIADREAIISVLYKAPDGLEPLRSVLLAEHVGRRRSGLSG
jgi:hypothetical protein